MQIVFYFGYSFDECSNDFVLLLKNHFRSLSYRKQSISIEILAGEKNNNRFLFLLLVVSAIKFTRETDIRGYLH